MARKKQLSIAQLTKKLHDFLEKAIRPRDESKGDFDDESDIQDFGRNVRRAGLHMAHRGHTDLFDESLQAAKELPQLPGYGPVSTRNSSGKYFSKCLAALTQPQSLTSTAEMPAKSGAPSSLNFKPTQRKPRVRLRSTKYVPPVHVTAYKQYKEAESVLGGFVSDLKAYGWLMRRYPKLPKLRTWMRYVRGGRRAYDDRKNNPRHGREFGGSIVKASEI